MLKSTVLTTVQYLVFLSSFMVYKSVLWHSFVTWVKQIVLLYLTNDANEENRLFSDLPSCTVIKPHSDLQTTNPLLYLLFQGGLVWVGEVEDSGGRSSS